MSLTNSKIIPTAFWIGFLALGFATSFGGPDKHRGVRVTPPANPAASPALAAEAIKKTEADGAAVAVHD
jgi:hypothetical protein